MIFENLIILKGGTYNDIKKALRQWIELYSKDLEDGLTFQVYKHRHGNHIIQADKRLDNEKFYFLINYLKYPEGIKYKIEIEGFAIGKENNILQGKTLMVYLSSSDKDYDNVFVTTSENENFKVDFSGRIIETREKKTLNFPTDLNMEYPEIIKVCNKEIDKKEEINKNRLDKRFKIISLIVVSLLALSLIINLYDKQAFIKFSFFLGMGIGLWFFADYKMLQSNKLYLYCLGISVAYLLYAVRINGEFNKDILEYGALYPLIVLLVQKPIRLMYKAILNREPVVDRPPPTFWDGVYTIVLFFGLAALPFIIMDIFM